MMTSLERIIYGTRLTSAGRLVPDPYHVGPGGRLVAAPPAKPMPPAELADPYTVDVLLLCGHRDGYCDCGSR